MASEILYFNTKSICNLSGKISPGVKKTCIYIICFLLYGTCYCWYSIIGMGTQLTLLSRMLESIFLIIVLIFLGLEKPLKPVKWNGLFIYCWFALGMLILIMGFFNEAEYGILDDRSCNCSGSSVLLYGIWEKESMN